MSAKPLRVVSSRPLSPASIDVPMMGWLCGFETEKGLLVDFPQNPAQVPVAARWTFPLDQPTLDEALRNRQLAIIIFEGGDPSRPVVTGLVQPLQVPAATPSTLTPLSKGKTEARIDGKRLTFDAEDEIVLRCGEASITLRRNGTVQLKGAYIVSHSRGTNRIRGGTVQIN